jgi:tripartite-type tricarboxylate transporter receptor subunit TctC
MVVPYAPGGATDVIARNLAERMKASLGQPVIIENVTGAGGPHIAEQSRFWRAASGEREVMRGS